MTFPLIFETLDPSAQEGEGDASIKPGANGIETRAGVRVCVTSECANAKSVHRAASSIPFFIFRPSTCLKICGGTDGRTDGRAGERRRRAGRHGLGAECGLHQRGSTLSPSSLSSSVV